MSSRGAVPIALAILLACAALALARGSFAAGDPGAGKKIFLSRCIACHKVDGTGGVKLTGNPSPNWKDPKYVNNPKWNEAYLRDCITNGKIKSGMVAWGKTGQIKPPDIDNLIAYIQTLAAKKR
jgi:mono/diheme cytochrome c family protein